MLEIVCGWAAANPPTPNPSPPLRGWEGQALPETS
jgi:hypothetical protein